MATKKTSNAEKVFSDAELEAMQDAKIERKKGKKGDGLADLLAKIAELNDSDRAIAERLHALVTENAPDLSPKTWYGMPAWANKDGKVVCFLTPAGKFDSRYASFGFNDPARLDDGSVWPTSYAVTKLTPADEKMFAALLKKSVS
ncbi:iron chaperone [Devosia sp.]|uniref:iron chaperone n=1 Tax=Devosia sp. TaxID=1871048 RepID=UPI002FC5CC55